MKTIAIFIAAFTPLMLLIHLSTARILSAWGGEASSWIKRWFSPRRALRVEAVYWALALAAWPLWRASGWKITVGLFSGIHLAFWLVGELHPIRVTNGVQPARGLADPLQRLIVGFDLIEAAILCAVGWIAFLYALGGAHGFRTG
jgi:hypothetical protein